MPTAPGEDGWHLFNDFLVRPTKREEALSFNPAWKLPSVLTFQIKSANNHVDDSWKSNLDTSLLYQESGYALFPSLLPHNPPTDASISPNPSAPRSHTPLNPLTERPTHGTILALDTEFVSIRQPEIEINSDGDRATIRPIVYALARVSVVRGPAPPTALDASLPPATPLIDDYIASREPIVDYLTSYSGIQAGDLDPRTSPHSLVSLKTAYKRLWILVNLSVTFLGHGLKQDFRVVNIQVPKAQVIDTAELFFVAARLRKLSLAFLAWVLLKEDIQVVVHDSIEDARTALRLWGKWREFVEAGVLEEVLADVYRVGRECGFRPPGRGGEVATPSKNGGGTATPVMGTPARNGGMGTGMGTPVRNGGFGTGMGTPSGLGTPSRGV